ncbi:MAG: glycoside hydrolase family 97 N-terminal domain-containing protein [candidate division KSB1 bacterium]|nr:glycoside hydrolase family 97 N-terminal domain-containing protein [candidate division KSB1 bacterium]
MIEPVAPTKFAQIHDHCVQATLNFETSQLQVRAYNNGAAYRWITKSENETNIRRERLQWPVKPDAQVYFPSETSMLSHNERIYKVQPFSGIVPDSFCSLPVLLQIDDVNVLFTEADVYDYPCMF